MRIRSETPAVRVTAPARLHLGFLDLNGEIGRRYGSIGLAIADPATELVVRKISAEPGADTASGPEAARVLRILGQLVVAGVTTGSHAVEIARAIPAHAGLGSGTQLALAVAGGCLAASGGASEANTIGEIADRGRRSAIGIAAFQGGGFIVDGGKGGTGRPPPVLMQHPFPASWRILLALDPAASGVHGDRETQAFAALEPMPRATAAHLAHLVLMRAAPALVEEDLAPFGEAITEIQHIVGAHFAAAQGGSPWSNTNVGVLMRAIGAAGGVGIGQSSWGPTGFAFTNSDEHARRLYHSFVGQAKALGLDLMIVAGRNTGAAIETIAPHK
ncbi:MAG: GHMP kinase [Hyphomicrobiaceae bacterium]|nr:GHMP kinase [Hyphomicrobiaceae bacterium]